MSNLIYSSSEAVPILVKLLFNIEVFVVFAASKATVIVAPLFVTPIPFPPSIEKAASPESSCAALPPPESVVIVTLVISPVDVVKVT